MYLISLPYSAANGWLQDITHSSGTTTLASYQYEYYKNGNRSKAIEEVQNHQFASLNSDSQLVASAPNVTQPIPSSALDVNVSYKPVLPSNPDTTPLQQVDFSRLPLSFVANVGQTDKTVKFQTSSLGGSIYFASSEVVLALMDNKVKTKKEEDSSSSSSADESKVVSIQYINAEKNPVVEGLDPQPGVANFMVGSDKKAWVSEAPTYGGILYRGLYPGIDLKYEGTEGNLKSTFTVAAGIDPALIQWQYKDSKTVSLDVDGNLLVVLPAKKSGQADTTLIEHKPIAWQEQNGQRVDVPIQFAVSQKGGIRFVFPQGYNTSLPLTIDPVLTYSTYLGADGTDRGKAITTDSDGNAYVTGYSTCGSFPLVNPIQTGGAGAHDVIISKISADGHTLLFSTCVGGTADEIGFGIALDAQGQITVAGETKSTDFPIVGGIATYGGNTGICTVEAPCQDNFLLSLNAAGTAIRFSTYLGGNGREEFGGIAVDASGKLVVVGSTTSTNFPTFHAFDSSYATGGTCTNTSPCWDATVTKIDPAGTGTAAILYSTYLGGTTRDRAYGVSLDSTGIAYIIGHSDSDGYPTRNALQAARKGSYDVVITEIDPSLSDDASLLYSTYLGTSSSDSGYAIARDSSGNLYLTGRTSSSRFPLRDPLQYQSHASTNCAGSSCFEAFVTKLNISTNTIVYSTYLGGTANEEAYGIALDSYGRAYVTGFTESTDFPTFDALQSTKGTDGCGAAPCADAFLSVLEPNGQSFAYSTYIGGNGEDIANGLALDTAGNVYVVGQTYSTDFVTTSNAYDLANTNNNTDAFIVKIAALGAPTPANPIITSSVSVSSDDAEQSASGSMSLTSTDLELIHDTSDQKVGIRFTGVSIPQGATIVNASVQFAVDAVSTDATMLTIQAQASDNAPTFTSTNSNISSRTKTTASVPWSPPFWSTQYEAGPGQRTPNLASVIQEVISRPGWVSGNALAVIIAGTANSKRVATAYDGNVYGAPYLHIEYTVSTPEPPTDTPTPTSTSTSPATSTFTPTPTPTATNTPAAVNSGWIDPAANAAVTTGSGDNNGFQTNPANAYSDNATFAVDTDSGNSTSTSCTNTGKDRHTFYTYNLSSVPSGSTIVGLEVRLDMKVDSTSGTPQSCVELSWDNGTTWTTPKLSSTFTTTETSYILGSAVDTWGRSWTTSELNNLRVRITNVSSSTSRDFSLDWIPVRVSYLLPEATPTNTPTLTPTATATFTSTPTPTATASFTPTSTITSTPTNTPIPPGPITIMYDYDPLNRLTAADYSTGDYYHYTYDTVGNRLSQSTFLGSLPMTTEYGYDDANRIQTVNGVMTYTFDDNGNLLSDGVNTYHYDSANRLNTLTGSVTANYSYNGLGDRLSETMNGQTTNFIMDYNTGLTQVLNDGTNNYIYGNGRIAQTQSGSTEFFLGDGLGSVRQLADASGLISYARAYDPYGVVTTTTGSSQSDYGYTGEYSGDYNELVYLRSRFYAPVTGRFITQDTWTGDAYQPMSYNSWLYVYSNPVNLTDPTGMYPAECLEAGNFRDCLLDFELGTNYPSDISIYLQNNCDNEALASLRGDPNKDQAPDTIIGGLGPKGKTLYRLYTKMWNMKGQPGAWWWRQYGAHDNYSLVDFAATILVGEVSTAPGLAGLKMNDFVEALGRHAYAWCNDNRKFPKPFTCDSTTNRGLIYFMASWSETARNKIDACKTDCDILQQFPNEYGQATINWAWSIAHGIKNPQPTWKIFDKDALWDAGNKDDQVIKDAKIGEMYTKYHHNAHYVSEDGIFFLTTYCETLFLHDNMTSFNAEGCTLAPSD